LCGDPGLNRDFQRRTTNKTRWNMRGPGNGRFPGFGLIRAFGNTVHM
jgi:hypothetical protein